MTALIVNLVEILNSVLYKTQTVDQKKVNKKSDLEEEHSKNLARPPIYHQVLDEMYVNEFDEIIVIGDVHGCFDEMMDLINQAENSKLNSNSKILKIFVGDLINKGPKNKEVINYMITHSKNCISVRGNHEEISIKTYFRHIAKMKSIENGDDKLQHTVDKYEWSKSMNTKEIDYLISLPYTISLPSENAIIVHAGLIAGLPLERHSPYDLVHMRNYVFDDYFDGKGLYSVKSDKQGEPWAPNWPGPQHVYFGHNSKLGLQKCQYATGIDTGCVGGNYLTGVFIKGPRKGCILRVKSRQAYKVKQADLKKKIKKQENNLNTSE